MSRRCIAVVLSKPSKKYQAEILKGIYESAFAEDMNVAVFSSTLKRGSDEYYKGEMEIFSLINMDKLSGIIYLPDTMEGDDIEGILTKPLVKMARESNVPIITIDLKIDGVLAICGDDRNMITETVNHIIDVHGCTDIAYITGYEGHPHAERRLEAYKDAMLAHGLEVDESRTYYGDFWYNSARPFVDKLRNSKRGLPQAIICANDYMAESVYKYLLELGISVPDDIILADYSEDDERLSFITSAIRNPNKTGAQACDILIRMMNGEHFDEQIIYSDYDFTIKPSITCGCKSAGEYNYLVGKGIFLEEVGGYFSETNTLNESLLICDNYTDLLWVIDWSTIFLDKFDDIYFCFCDDWNSPDANSDRHSKFTDEMILYYYRKNRDGKEFEKHLGDEMHFSKDDIFPYLNSSEGKPSAYFLRSIHYENRCFGYSVINYADRLEVPDSVYDYWLKDVANAMESQRRKQEVMHLYNRMESLAVTDILTRLFNRNGFNSMAPEFVADAKRNGKQTMLIMFDMNGLKYINDNYGHSAGDESICKAAEIISDLHIKGAERELNFRFGGDEYVKLASGKLDENAERDFITSLRKATDEYNIKGEKPYPMYISIGISIKQPCDSLTLDDMLSEADNRMYEHKKKLKAETGFKPARK